MVKQEYIIFNIYDYNMWEDKLLNNRRTKTTY